jgi:hypothetical protein
MVQKRPPESNAAQKRKLTSVNLSTDMLAWVDVQAKKAKVNRSHLLELILEDFRNNERIIEVTIRIGDKEDI